MSLRWRIFFTLSVVLFFSYLAIANFISKDLREKHWYYPDAAIRLGLDLQGGFHWVLGVKLEQAVINELDYQKAAIEAYFEEKQLTLASAKVNEERQVLELTLADAAGKALLQDYLKEQDTLKTDESDALQVSVTLTSDALKAVHERGMTQALEVLRRRIDDPKQGVGDSVITRQGEDRILIQIPGGKLDRESAQSLLRQGGFLEFKIVEQASESPEVLIKELKNQLGEALIEGVDAATGSPMAQTDTHQLVYERDRPAPGELYGKVLYAFWVPKQPGITGDKLEDARVAFDPTRGPVVEFTWGAEGTEIFRKLTEQAYSASEGSRKLLAIILDGNVVSAPRVNAVIGKRGVIEGNFSTEEANTLAVILTSGSLKIPITIEEERTVGPALGADSIRSGGYASIVGSVLVVLFMMVYYRRSGVYASLALIANVLLLLGVMSQFSATLTMPGIAGLVLTIGMAIDANVIIFERIREELRNGKTPRAAIETGFNKSLWTILDANITTLLSAIVLYSFGTGPVKGFAVTLAIGIVTSVFSALVVTRLLFHSYPGQRPVKELSI